MSSIKNSFSTLASSVLLNVGLTSAAEKFDSMRNCRVLESTGFELASEDCIIIACNFTPEAGQ